MWRATLESGIEGVTSDSDLIVAPYRESKICHGYSQKRISGSFAKSGWSWGTTKVDSEPDDEYFLVLSDGEVVDPCSICRYSSFRLGGSCAPLGFNCLSREDKWEKL